MDRAFMEHYFNSVYEDIIGSLTEENEDYQKAKKAFYNSQNEFLKGAEDREQMLR